MAYESVSPGLRRPRGALFRKAKAAGSSALAAVRNLLSVEKQWSWFPVACAFVLLLDIVLNVRLSKKIRLNPDTWFALNHRASLFLRGKRNYHLYRRAGAAVPPAGQIYLATLFYKLTNKCRVLTSIRFFHIAIYTITQAFYLSTMAVSRVAPPIPSLLAFSVMPIVRCLFITEPSPVVWHLPLLLAAFRFTASNKALLAGVMLAFVSILDTSALIALIPAILVLNWQFIGFRKTGVCVGVVIALHALLAAPFLRASPSAYITSVLTQHTALYPRMSLAFGFLPKFAFNSTLFTWLGRGVWLIGILGIASFKWVGGPTGLVALVLRKGLHERHLLSAQYTTRTLAMALLVYTVTRPQVYVEGSLAVVFAIFSAALFSQTPLGARICIPALAGYAFITNSTAFYGIRSMVWHALTVYMALQTIFAPNIKRTKQTEIVNPPSESLAYRMLSPFASPQCLFKAVEEVPTGLKRVRRSEDMPAKPIEGDVTAGMVGL